MNFIISNADNSRRVRKKHLDGLIYKVSKGIYVKEQKHIFIYIEEILEHLNIEGIIFFKSALEYPKQIANSELFILSHKKGKKIVLGEQRDLIIHIIEITKTNKIFNNMLTKTSKDKLLIPKFEYAVLINFYKNALYSKKANKDFACEYIIHKTLEDYKDMKYLHYTLEKIEKMALHFEIKDVYDDMLNYFNAYFKLHYKDYDEKRVFMFKNLKEQLELSFIPYYDRADKNILFYEAYFSNYIEGTEFEVDEAQKIIFNPKHQYERHKDGHDIKATYDILKDIYDNPMHFDEYSDFVSTLKSIHTQLMSHRSDKIIVGDFKKHVNRSGQLRFVLPALVNNTLKEGFSLYKQLVDPMQKAIFIHMLIAEVHPFDDGNGRMSRIFMNNELSKANKSHIIIPTVFREDYITALKGFSHQGNSKPIISALIKAYNITNAIDWTKKMTDITKFIEDNSGFEKDINSVWGVKPSGFDGQEFSNIL